MCANSSARSRGDAPTRRGGRATNEGGDISCRQISTAWAVRRAMAPALDAQTRPRAFLLLSTLKGPRSAAPLKHRGLRPPLPSATRSSLAGSPRGEPAAPAAPWVHIYNRNMNKSNTVAHVLVQATTCFGRENRHRLRAPLSCALASTASYNLPYKASSHTHSTTNKGERSLLISSPRAHGRRRDHVGPWGPFCTVCKGPHHPIRHPRVYRGRVHGPGLRVSSGPACMAHTWRIHNFCTAASRPLPRHPLYPVS